MKAIDFEYYGVTLDEDDGVIVPLEQEYEKKRRSSAYHHDWYLASFLTFGKGGFLFLF